MKPEDTRNIEDLIRSVISGYTPRYVFFWGHTPPRDGSINHACLSQWYASPFEAGGIPFPTAEHFMMYSKARLFSDDRAAQSILSTPDPAAAKAAGRSVRGFEQAIWDANRFSIAVEGNYSKFQQNLPLLEYLLSTTGHVLAEASPGDAIWGIGMAKDAAGIEDPSNWRGKNLLGFALMEVRGKILR